MLDTVIPLRESHSRFISLKERQEPRTVYNFFLIVVFTFFYPGLYSTHISTSLDSWLIWRGHALIFLLDAVYIASKMKVWRLTCAREKNPKVVPALIVGRGLGCTGQGVPLYAAFSAFSFYDLYFGNRNLSYWAARVWHHAGLIYCITVIPVLCGILGMCPRYLKTRNTRLMYPRDR